MSYDKSIEAGLLVLASKVMVDKIIIHGDKNGVFFPPQSKWRK